MEFSRPAEYKKRQEESGEYSPDEIWDPSIFQSIREQIEASPFNVKESVSETTFSQESLKTLEDARSFCRETSEAFREGFLDLLGSYQRDHKELSPEIVSYLKEKHFDYPQFRIASGKAARSLLEDFNLYYDEGFKEEDILLVFQLPKPLAVWWWKGGIDSWGNRAVDVGDKIIEWGHFYREFMEIVWEMQRYYENEKGISFLRMNDVSEHDPQKYYYVWRFASSPEYNEKP